VTSICVRPFIAEELDPRHLEAPADIPLHGMGFVQKAPEPERIEAVLWKIGSVTTKKCRLPQSSST